MKHTTGPWQFTEDDDITCTVMDATGELIVARTAIPEDAQLIAMAPQLLTSVEDLILILRKVKNLATLPMDEQDTIARAQLFVSLARSQDVIVENELRPSMPYRPPTYTPMERVIDEKIRQDWTGKVQFEDREEGS